MKSSPLATLAMDVNYDDDLSPERLPELYDEDEDRDDLTAYVHIAELVLQD